MDELILKQIASAFLEKYYDLSLGIPVIRNNRLRSTYGRFMIKNGHAWRIELAGILLDYGTKEVIEHILKHECIHYALFENKLPYKDGDIIFEKELKKHHVPGTRQLLIGKFFNVQCEACGRTSWTDKKRIMAYPEQYRSGCCRKTIHIIGEQIFNGENKQAYDKV